MRLFVGLNQRLEIYLTGIIEDFFEFFVLLFFHVEIYAFFVDLVLSLVEFDL